MQPHSPRLLLTLALAAVLGACGDDQPATPAAADTAATPAAAGTIATTPAAPARPVPKALPAAVTPYETALKSLNGGSSVHFEGELTMAGGGVQYASGVGRDQDFAFSVRSLPKPDDRVDGTWLLDNGRYLRQSTTGYDVSITPPDVVTRMLDALNLLPRTEAELASDAGADSINGVECQSRAAVLSHSPALLSQYKALSACVDTTNARILKVAAQWQTGDALTASFSAHGEPVEMPQSQTTDWSQQFPRRK